MIFRFILPSRALQTVPQRLGARFLAYALMSPDLGGVLWCMDETNSGQISRVRLSGQNFALLQLITFPHLGHSNRPSPRPFVGFASQRSLRNPVYPCSWGNWG